MEMANRAEHSILIDFYLGSYNSSCTQIRHGDFGYGRFKAPYASSDLFVAWLKLVNDLDNQFI